MEFITTNENQGPDKFKDIFFNRPVSSFSKPLVGFLVGRHANLNEIDQAHKMFSAFGLRPVIVADQTFKSSALPADVFLVSKDKIRYENSDEAIERLSGCKAIYIISGNEINAAMSLFMSRLARVYEGLVISDDFKPLDQDWTNSSTKICIASTRRLISSNVSKNYSQTGLKLKAEYLFDVSRNHKCSVVAIDDTQVLALDYSDRQNIGVINSVDIIQRQVMSAMISALLAERPQPLAAGWLEYVLAAGYLYRNYFIQSGQAGVKEFLNNQF